MVTFILTPTFAISAFLVGALPLAYAAPLPADLRDAIVLLDRGCHQAGCLFVKPSRSVSSTPVATSTSTPAAVTTPSVSDPSDIAEDPPDPVAAVARALGTAISNIGEFTTVSGEAASVSQI
ncbi:hypothetical protein DICSQDRAFT_184287 [Dichomitus squalens LYAD-421 SS1]|uniref:Fungal calcium binding protein domain-containing protein n=1 Tax=Dichomitus squalens (strain LYAD-421) TaxID=732165 RepID=R7SJX3_DICSQ|nr:uncharacterized protein DICSQDRAFT_184287 [Dichomitus squalens LYAD-421 SS1]EJF55337.1 hypothetical protein DICSQDRAFT_184287 [Dichomitus squalens LYAD-421 SS1]